MKELTLIAIKASIEAGHEILRIYDGDFDVETKADNSPLTLADKNANDIITSYLEKTDYPILSEEGRTIAYNERKHWEFYWIVDPLDGTKEFVKRNGNFTVNIALMHNDIPVLGIIYIPVSDELYFGGGDMGSYKHSEISGKNGLNYNDLTESQYKLLPTTKPSDRYTIAASSSHLSTETQEYINELEKKHGEISIISRGSSLKICLVAEGMAREYPRFAPTMEWDIAAGNAIILGVGKQIIDYSTGKPISYNKENLLNDWFIVK